MAARLSLSEEDLCCPVCSDIFREPVVLQCSHSFCKACLQQYWTQKISGRDCPLCRCESTTNEPVVSLTLKNLCDSYVEGTRVRGEAIGQEQTGELCILHGEKLKLFCLEDGQPICVVCHTSKMHKHHECCPVGEAVLDFKVNLRAALKTLREKLEAFDKSKKDFEDTATYVKTQAQQTEEQIKEEFEKLHRFLRLEEEARLNMLKEEEEEKSQTLRAKIEAVEIIMADLSASISAIEEEIQVDDISLLHKYETTMKRAQPTIQDPELGSGVLINVDSYLGCLKYKVWKKMQEIVHFTPVTLDPNTAAPWLILSEELTTVADSDGRQQLPENPERFILDAAVLGARGYSSGYYTWDVEVGDNGAWVLGVVKESAQRKEKVPSVLKNGYLSIYYYHKMYFAGTSPLTRLNLKKKPLVIRVILDYDRGKVTFSDHSNHTHIYTFKHSFSEMLYPYFWIGSKECPLRILPMEISTNLEHSL
ncbi:hypothetical protein GJAV_G00159940 [Gymnothorax javanicus]|nr:hypothetical protein GJAV_G00159940 [Gymnothorax javanicus]